jgi:hypothetical protein
VADPEASARFLEQTFGFEREMAADGFVSLTRPDVGFNVIYLRAGLPTFRPRDRAARTADGLLVVLLIDDIDAEYGRLTAAASRSSPRSRPRTGASGTSRSPIPTG